MSEKKSIKDLVIEYFQNHPKQDITHSPVVDWVEEKYLEANQKKPRDTWRQIRKLSEEGFLIKVKKGVYRYDPDLTIQTDLDDFPIEIKKMIFERDDYRCVVCGRGRKDGVEICADHILPKSKGGESTIENGQTLCAEHNIMKKNYSQTETGKRYFIKVYEKAVLIGDQRMLNFCKSIFDVYDKFEVNGHIKRPNGFKKEY